MESETALKPQRRDSKRAEYKCVDVTLKDPQNNFIYLLIIFKINVGRIMTFFF